MTKDDYISWRSQETTQAFTESAIHEMNLMVAELISTAGDHPLQDKYRRGMIDGLRWLTEWVPTVEDVTIEEEIEDDSESSGSQDSY